MGEAAEVGEERGGWGGEEDIGAKVGVGNGVRVR